MTYRAFLLIGLEAFALAAVSAAEAQLPRRLENCLPTPSLADDLRVRRGEAKKKPEPTPAKPEARVRVAEVTIVGNSQILGSELDEWIASLRKLELDASSNWLERVAEVEAPGFWNDRGYFQARITATPRLIGWEGRTTQLVAVTLKVNAGRQFRTGEITFANGTVFPEQKLRDAIPLKKDDLFNVSKVRQGLQALQRFYDDEGYVDFTVAPLTHVHPLEEGDYVSLRLELSEDKRYFFGGVEVLGEHPARERLLEWNGRRGEVFRTSLMDEFLKTVKEVLPADASGEDVALRRDLKKGLVFLVLDLRTCP